MAKYSTVKERLTAYIKHTGLSARAFARRAGLPETFVSSMRNSTSAEKLNRILDRFPDLNRTWLITGDGKMLNSYNMESNITSLNELSSVSVPLYSINAIAGIKTGQTDGEEIEDMVPWIDAREGDLAVRVEGDSMEPRIHDGAYVLLRPCVADPRDLAYGHIHLVVTEDRAALKIIRTDRDNPRALQLISLNDVYPPFSIPFEDIRHIYRAVSTLSML